MAFSVIETQEQFDELVKDRIERAKESARKEAEKELKELTSLREKIKASEEADKGKDELIQKLQEELDGAKKTVGELNTTVRGLEMSAKKAKIAHEYGLPYEMASRLNGDTDEEIQADAEALKGFIAKPTTAPVAGYEKAPADDRRSKIASMLSNMGVE